MVSSDFITADTDADKAEGAGMVGRGLAEIARPLSRSHICRINHISVRKVLELHHLLAVASVLKYVILDQLE